ncbi:xanthine dehydrogenase small subunit [Patescibacteria group bacterium]|nr:xanthine dehydrogenase small subunit [Patescibacteria group bacterium]
MSKTQHFVLRHFDMTKFLLNQKIVEIDLPQETALLDVLRQQLNLTGTKNACHEGDCGACLVLLGHLTNGYIQYQAVNSCLLPLGTVAGCHIVTIEGINQASLNPIQQALVDNGAIQCGFCTSGLVITLIGFLLASKNSSQSEAMDAVAGNLCRCTGYAGIKRAVNQIFAQFKLNSPLSQRVADLVQSQVLPDYFLSVSHCLTPPSFSKGQLLIAGATDLLVQHSDSLRSKSLSFLPNTSEPVCIEDGQCVIQATATIEQLRTSPLLQSLLPTIAEDFKLIASSPIRHRATVGGNLVNASPIADLAIIFLALNAELITEHRRLTLKNFFLAYKKINLHSNETLQTIRFDLIFTHQFSYEKVSKRQYLDIASVNTAMSIEQIEGCIVKAHISAGGVAPIPLYLNKTCAYLKGKLINAKTIREAITIAQTEISPISDVRGSAAYKRLLFKQLLIAHFLKLFTQVRWEELYVHQ